MLYAKDLRAIARQKMDNSWSGPVWSTFALITLVYSLILGGAGAVTGGIVILLLSGPLALGMVQVSMKIMRGKRIEFGNLFDGYKDFSRAFLLALLNDIFVCLWSLLFIIPGIVKSYAYAMSYYILADNPQMSANEARKRSIELMKGNKWRLFCLQFSFFGWNLLTLLTFGILDFWITPYKQVATAAFYEEIMREKGFSLPDDASAGAPVNRSAQAPVGDGQSVSFCRNCGAPLTPDGKFCDKCGCVIKKNVCPSCKAINDDDATFCSTCGAHLK